MILGQCIRQSPAGLNLDFSSSRPVALPRLKNSVCSFIYLPIVRLFTNEMSITRHQNVGYVHRKITGDSMELLSVMIFFHCDKGIV